MLLVDSVKERGATKGLTMSKGLFGKVEPRCVELTIFCDERKMPRGQDGNEWWYICMLSIPTASVANVISRLMAIRKSHSFYKEVDSKRIKGASCNSPRTAVAIDWLRFLKNRTGLDIYWEVLGIATHNLDFSYFGPGDESTGKYATVYNRFFRTAFLFSANTYFSSYEQVVISNVFHDTEGNLQKHDFFDWHLPRVVANDRIQFLNDRICFVVSDHDKEKEYKEESQVIQLADILVGSVSQRLDNSSAREGKVELGDCLTDMLYTVATNPWKAHDKGYDVSFFPQGRVSHDGIDHALGQKSRFFARKPKARGQLSLF